MIVKMFQDMVSVSYFEQKQKYRYYILFIVFNMQISFIIN